MNLDPVEHLLNFGNDVLSEQDIRQAEKYLVRVWAGIRSNTTAETFDQRRVECFTKGVGLDSLPPTTSVIRGHIHRGAYLIRKACSLLTEDMRDRFIDPLENGWVEKFGMLVPAKCMKSLPETVLKLCKCEGTCLNKRCTCKAANVKCTIYCHGKNSTSTCANSKS